MPAFLLHITAKPGREQAAVEGLTDIEQLSRKDQGCVSFVWLQHHADPLRFTLFEQWETQQDLDAHLALIMPTWELFAPNLDGDPVSETVVPVSAAQTAQQTGS